MRVVTKPFESQSLIHKVEELIAQGTGQQQRGGRRSGRVGRGQLAMDG